MTLANLFARARRRAGGRKKCQTVRPHVTLLEDRSCPSGAWATMAPMPTARREVEVAADPVSGLIYAVGGRSNTNREATTENEVYNPATNSWASKAPLPFPQSDNGDAVVNGIVYVIGGYTGSGFTNAVEAYDPATNTWSSRSPIPEVVVSSSVAVVNGIIYVVGGNDTHAPLAHTYAYDPTTDTWTGKAPDPGNVGRPAVGVINGIIYVAGGQGPDDSVATVEAYDPVTDTWTEKADMPSARQGTAGSVVDGKFYVMGGGFYSLTGSTAPLATVDVYDPATNTWTTDTSLPTARQELGAATVDGVIYAIGGRGASDGGGFFATNEAFTPAPSAIKSTTTSLSSSVNPSAFGQSVTFTATVSSVSPGRPTGTVAFEDATTGTPLGNAPIGIQSTTWGGVASMTMGRSSPGAATGPDGRIYVIGGYNNGAALNSNEAYDTTTGTWTTVASMPTARYDAAIATGPDGRIYVISGSDGASYFHAVEAYDTSTNTWASLAPIPTASFGPGAATGPDGRIYVVGGFNNGYLNTVEAYDPATNTWTTVASLPTAREAEAVATGPDGRIYVIGGTNGSELSTVEAYDTTTGTWSTLAPMPTARHNVAAVTGPDGRIYVIGGYNGSFLNTVEAYDPTTNSWTTMAGMSTARNGAGTATGPDGRLYAVGGEYPSRNYLNTAEALSFVATTPSVTTSSLAVGNHAIIATYSGDGDFAGSSGLLGGGQMVVQANTTTTVTSSSDAPLVGDGVTFTAAVANTDSGLAPDGGVEFYDGKIDLGPGTPAAGSGNQATWTFTTSSLTVGSHTVNAVFSCDGNFAGSTGTAPINVVAPSTIQGLVWVDFNDDGQVDFGESGIGGVTVTLTGNNDLGPVSRSLVTDTDGACVFQNLRPGDYHLTETQPSGYLQGIDTVGTAGGSLAGTDDFSIPLGPGVDGMNYNFGEQPPATGPVRKGQTAGIGFWNNKNGQSLIKSLNSGAGTELGDWLAATLPHMFGVSADSNDLTGKNNAAVAALFQHDFLLKGVKLDAQVLATALSVYATSTALDSTGVAAKYGFTVSGDGVGTAAVNVGNDGEAFGVANNASMTVMDLLLATDAQSVNGVLYGGNTTKRNEANDIYGGINQAGGI